MAIQRRQGGQTDETGPPERSAGPSDRPRVRRALRIALVAAGVLLLLWIFRRAGWPAIAANLARVGPWFPALVALYALAQVAFALGWWVLIEPRPAALHFSSLFGVYLAGDSANYLAPGNVAGEPLKVHLLSDRVGAAPALASITIHKHADMLAQWAFMLAGVVIAVASFRMPAAARIAALAGTLLFGVLLLVFTWALRRGTYSPVLRGLARWKPLARRIERFHRPAEAADRQIQEFYDRHPGRFAASLGWCFLGWCGGLLESWLVLRLIAPGSGWAAAFAVEALAMTLNNVLLFIPARIGSAEGVRVGVFLLIGLTAAQGVAYGLLRRGRELVWIVPGLLVIARRHSLGARRADPEEVATLEAPESAS